MKSLTMLTVVINALVQQEEMVTVITCLHYISDGIHWIPYNSYNAYKAYNVIGPYYREKCSGRDGGFKVSLVCSQATYFSVMTTIPRCQDLELLMAPFLNSQLTLTHQLEWDCKSPYFQAEQFISCLKIPNPCLIENQKVRAKIRCGFKVKGSSQLAVICTCLRMETQHLSLQTRFVQNTLVSQNDVSNNTEWQIGLKQQLNMLSTWKILV